jgi:hypothetical protein
MIITIIIRIWTGSPVDINTQGESNVINQQTSTRV